VPEKIYRRRKLKMSYTVQAWWREQIFSKNVLFSCIPSGSYLSPFYAVKEYDLTRGNYGGIETNLAGEVTDKDGNAIPGLYAAGIISSAGFFGDYYPGREAFGVGAYMGFISGENAAKYAAK